MQVEAAFVKVYILGYSQHQFSAINCFSHQNSMYCTVSLDLFKLALDLFFSGFQNMVETKSRFGRRMVAF